MASIPKCFQCNDTGEYVHRVDCFLGPRKTFCHRCPAGPALIRKIQDEHREKLAIEAGADGAVTLYIEGSVFHEMDAVDAFAKHLEAARVEVSKWPKWKQEALGPIVVPDKQAIRAFIMQRSEELKKDPSVPIDP